MVDGTTYSTARMPTMGEILADMHRMRDLIAALGPMPLRVELRPGEHLPIPLADSDSPLALTGLRVIVNPDVPPGEVWIPKSDGTTLKIVNVALPEENHG